MLGLISGYGGGGGGGRTRTFHEAHADVAELREPVEVLVAPALLHRELQLVPEHAEVVRHEARRRRHLTDLQRHRYICCIRLRVHIDSAHNDQMGTHDSAMGK